MSSPGTTYNTHRDGDRRMMTGKCCCYLSFLLLPTNKDLESCLSFVERKGNKCTFGRREERQQSNKQQMMMMCLCSRYHHSSLLFFPPTLQLLHNECSLEQKMLQDYHQYHHHQWKRREVSGRSEKHRDKTSIGYIRPLVSSLFLRTDVRKHEK